MKKLKFWRLWVYLPNVVNLFSFDYLNDVFDAFAASHGVSDFGARDVVAEPLRRQMNIVSILVDYVMFVDELLGIRRHPADNHLRKGRKGSLRSRKICE